ncbi:MAG: glycyl-radical enzyme activating protein [Clostridia bacterium]|nr:glycyl-radical enzyme activating protein [Clostridia bacterium]
MKQMIFDIQRFSVSDGPGIRTTVFFKGCNLRCAWCHNPESQSSSQEILFYQNKCNACGKCREICPSPDNCTFCGKCEIFCAQNARKVCGKEYTVDEVLAEVLKDRILYRNGNGGVTLSGGECMLNPGFCAQLLQKLHENQIHTAIDTAGNVPWSHFETVLPYTNLFLYDVKCMDSEKHKTYTGVGNTLILDNLGKLLDMNIPVWIRVPVIPSVNDSKENIAQLRKFLSQHKQPEKIEFLPYHSIGVSKARAIGQIQSVFQIPSQKSIDELEMQLYSL